MNEDNENVGINDDDQTAFEAEFFGGQSAPVVDNEPVEEVTEVEDDLGEEEVETPATDEDDDEDEKPEPKGKNRKSAQERINELTAKARQEEREKIAAQQRETDLIRRLEELEKAVKREEQPLKEKLPEGAPNPEAKDENGDPLYELGEYDPEFIRDITKFTIEQEVKAAREAEAREAEARYMKEAQEQLQNEWFEKLEKAEEAIPDLRDNIRDLTETFQGIQPQYGEYLAATIMASEVGPEIMHYLSQNIGEAQKIVASGPAAATLMLGRLEAKLIKTPTAEEPKRNKRVSDAPPPPEDRARGTGGRFAVAPDTDDQQAFEREFFKKN